MSDFKIPFGSHKGRTVAEIYKIDRQYVLWLRDETTGLAQKAAQEFITKENQRIIQESKRPQSSLTHGVQKDTLEE